MGSLESLADTIDMISTLGLIELPMKRKSEFEKFLEDVVKISRWLRLRLIDTRQEQI